MSYRELIVSVRSHVDKLGVPCRYQAGWPLLPWSVTLAERKLGFSLPADLKDFYREIGNGMRLVWIDETPSRPDIILGGIHVPHLGLLVRHWRERKNGILYDAAAADRYGFPYTKDPELAKKTAARMWNWLPVLHHENGDEFSLDMECNRQAVIFDKHDWLDGGSGDNGFPVANSWRCFFESWAEHCFQHPKSMYWMDVLTPSGLDWDSEHFDPRFKIQGK